MVVWIKRSEIQERSCRAALRTRISLTFNPGYSAVRAMGRTMERLRRGAEFLLVFAP
jgi:hypothetical protein